MAKTTDDWLLNNAPTRSWAAAVKLTKNTKKPANLFAPKISAQAIENQTIGRFFRVYPVQSVHAPHSEEVNAARAS
jgi:hypothetical protein